MMNGARAKIMIAMGAALMLCACASAPMPPGQTLSSYDGMVASDGVLTKSLIRANKQEILGAHTIRIIPTTFSGQSGSTLSEGQRALVTNTIDRSLCAGLSDRFEVVNADTPADLTIHATVIHSEATNEVAAGVSKVAAVIPSALGVPGMVPRIPIGLGSLTIEGEALDRAKQQQAALIWGRGANSFTSAPRISKIGDAYELASNFGEDFSQLLVTGESPFGKMGSLPSQQKIGTSLGGEPKYAACKAFGRNPGVGGAMAGVAGLPPEWIDKGEARAKP